MKQNRLNLMIHRYQKEIDAVKNNNLPLFKSFFNSKEFDPSFLEDWSIRYSSEVGNIDIVKLLLKDERVNPSSCNNSPITDALKYNHTEIIQLLWNDQRVKKSLQKNNQELYNQLITKDIENKVEGF